MKKATIANILALLLSVLVINQSYSQLSINEPALDSLLIACKKSHSADLVVYFNGKSIADYSLDENAGPSACFSVLKSISAIAVGMLIDDKKINNINQPVADFFPEWRQGLKSKITIKHLLNHTSGIACDEPGDDYFASPNVVQHALCADITDTPGTKFNYNSKAFLLLLGIIGKASGTATDKYLEKEIFSPLNIRKYKWDYDSSGNVKELLITSSELVKIGQLVLNKGSWNSMRLISEGWINQLLEPSQPFAQDCGLLWWIIPDTTYYIVDDAIISEFKKAGVKQSILDKFNALKGVYTNENIAVDKLKLVFGEEWQSVLDKEFYPHYPIRSRRKYSSKIIGYKAEGYAGQYIVIYPAKNLVAARMIKVTGNYKAETDEMLDFSSYVYKIIN